MFRIGSSGVDWERGLPGATQPDALSPPLSPSLFLALALSLALSLSPSLLVSLSRSRSLSLTLTLVAWVGRGALLEPVDLSLVPPVCSPGTHPERVVY